MSIRPRGAASTKFTLSITVAINATKLAIFDIFKGKPGVSADKRQQNIMPD